MYLLLVDQNFITSSDLKEMMERSPAGTDIVNCFSTDTLLKIAERVKPDIVLIDFDMAGDDLGGLFKQVREASENAHIIALIAAGYYEELNKAIETGGVDDYIVKPIQKDDFMARVHLAAKRITPAVVPAAFATVAEDLVSSAGEAFDFDDAADFKAEEPVTADVQTQTEGKPITEDEFSALFETDLDEDTPAETVEPEDDEPVIVSTFDDQDLLEPVAEEQKSNDDFASSDFFDTEQYETEPDPVVEEALPEIEKPAESDNLFDDIAVFGEEQAESKVDIFEDDLGPLEQAPAAEGSPGSEQGSWDFSEDEFFEETSEQETVVQDRPEPKEIGLKKDDDSSFVLDAAPAGEQYFDDLFDYEDSAPAQKSSATPPVTSKPEADQFDIFDDVEPEPPVSRREVVRESPFPGESADDFLFGETDLEDIDQVPDPLKKYVADKSERRETEANEFDNFADDFSFADDIDEAGSEGKKKAYKVKKKSKKGSGGNFLTVLGNVFFVCLLLMMATLSFFLIQSRISGGVPQVAGYQMYIVLSGSMSPEFDTGSLAFVKETDPLAIVVGDIITFRSQSGSDSLTTHRVVEVLREDGLQFVTRGDANNVNDPNPVPAENVVGTVTGSIPYLGYVMNFVQTSTGLILLIFVPGVLIILFELSKIVRYMTEGDGTPKKKGRKKHSQTAEDFD
jgi:signal peptidase